MVLTGAIIFGGGGGDVLTNSGVIDPTKDFTVYFDFKTTSTDKQAIILVGHHTTDNDIVCFWGGDIGIESEGGATGYMASYTSDQPIALDTWYRITLSRVGTDLALYVNDTRVTHYTHDPAGRGSGDSPKIGWNTWGEYLAGRVSAGAMFDGRAFDNTEVSDQLVQGKPLDETGVFGEYRYDDTAGGNSELDDDTANANDWNGTAYNVGTGSGTPWLLASGQPAGKRMGGVPHFGLAQRGGIAHRGVW